MTTLPTADILTVAYGTGINRNIRTVTVRCPYCLEQHTHGWPPVDGETDPGYRAPHCSDQALARRGVNRADIIGDYQIRSHS